MALKSTHPPSRQCLPHQAGCNHDGMWGVLAVGPSNMQERLASSVLTHLFLTLHPCNTRYQTGLAGQQLNICEAVPSNPSQCNMQDLLVHGEHCVAPKSDRLIDISIKCQQLCCGNMRHITLCLRLDSIVALKSIYPPSRQRLPHQACSNKDGIWGRASSLGQQNEEGRVAGAASGRWAHQAFNVSSTF